MRQLDTLRVSMVTLCCVVLPAAGQVGDAGASSEGSRAADDSRATAAADRSPAGPTSTGPAPPADSSPEARAALERVVARYRSLQSYQDRFRCAAYIKMKTGADPEVGYLEGSLVFAAPNRVASKTESLHVYSDGQQFTRYLPAERQYVVGPADRATQALQPKNWPTLGAAGLAVHPLIALLAVRDLPADDALLISSLTGVAAETHAGHAGLRLTGRLQLADQPGLPAAPFNAFINEQTQLFEEIRLDVAELFRASFKGQGEGDPPSVESAEVVVTFQDVVVDAAVPEGSFAFDSSGARKVKQLGYAQAPVASPVDLLGEEAALTGPTLAGQDFDLATQRGRVVIVAFWATWSPGARDLLDQLQTLARDHLKDPVTVIGVNRNGAGGEGAVRRILGAGETTFTQVLDREGKNAEAWHVAALPAVYLVDQKGIVAEVYPTWDPASCSRQLAALLKSEPLYTPAARQARRDALAEDLGGAVVQAPTSQPGSARLVAGESQALTGSRWNMCAQDIDGDGEVELIFPGWSGELSVLKPSTGDVQRVPLRGTANNSVMSVCPARIDGETCWFCALQQHSLPAETYEQRVQVRLYAPGGELLWTFTPEVAEKTNSSATVAAGDLDGDGAVEYAVGMTTYTPVPTGEHAWTWSDTHSWLLVLDGQGRLIEQQEFSNQVELVYIPPGKPGHPVPLLCLVGGELQRFSLRPQAQ